MQAIIPHIPQLVQSVVPQHPKHSTVQPDLPASWEEPSALQPIKGLRFPHKVRSGTPGAIVGHSMSNTRVTTPNVPEPYTLSSDLVDSLKALLRHVNRRLDKVQKEFVKSEELGESSKGGSRLKSRTNQFHQAFSSPHSRPMMAAWTQPCTS
ncbi:hypothetical protein GW17_00030716 [Ensete ventricosum]|nr:hypothetical protein GW17_00030716 [Ensete ventricosum]